MAAAKHVLIVEDEKPLSHALELKLQHEGFATTVAPNGQKCLELLRANKYDVVLLDMMMPVMDGFQVLQKVKEEGVTLPTTFVLSNLSMREDEDRILALGAKKFFIKSDTPLAVIVEEVKKA
ncbi:MAG TPA: response regulator [Verrucomicrobiae bacterium]|nr:response regulator [Verrucomicrobiae bacterium]